MKGDTLFKEYWNRPDATADAFDADGWFKTGDTAASEGSPPYWRILGRTSVDIIKSGGYKISALEIENALLTHPAVNECAVVGVEDEVQGQIVAAILTCHQGQEVCTQFSLSPHLSAPGMHELQYLPAMRALDHITGYKVLLLPMLLPFDLL